MKKDLIKKLELLWGVPVFYKKSGEAMPKSYGAYSDQESPFLHSHELVELLVKRSQNQEVPVIYKDEHKVYFICVNVSGGIFFTGPVCTEELNLVEIHRFYNTYHMKSKEEKPPVLTSLVKILAFTSFLYGFLEDKAVEADTLMEVNHLVRESIRDTKKEEVRIEQRSLDEEVYHHTYQEERFVMNCVREGDTKHIRDRMMALVQGAGTLSEKALNNQRNLAIVTVALATREAISGGLSPAEAYRLSDSYINRIDRCSSIEQMLEYMNSSIYEFTERVSRQKKKLRTSSYTEGCKDYISKNYHHKIHLEEMAESIGVSPGYLSRVFRQDMKVSIQEYIQKFRVERAANLLKYSEASLMEISDYVCFYSQSHFGSVFKKYMGMTPNQYREEYKQKEFVSKL